jgi:hypothetical protein
MTLLPRCYNFIFILNPIRCYDTPTPIPALVPRASQVRDLNADQHAAPNIHSYRLSTSVTV